MTKNSLGTFIQRRLSDLDKKQAYLADCTGLSPAYISDLVNDTAPSKKKGGYAPSPEVVANLARCLQCSRAEILVAMGYLPESEMGDPEEARLIERFRRMSGNVREVFALIGQTLDQRFAGKDAAGAQAGRVAQSDPRADTYRPVSAAKLPPQTAEKGATKKRGKNGV